MAVLVRNPGPEHTQVRLPVIAKLHKLGWSEGQLRWRPAWHVPETPHDAAKREVGKSFTGWPVDLVIFDSDEHANEWEHVQVLFEFKRPDLEGGVSQLETYLLREPRARYGYWTNGTDSVGVYKLADGTFEHVPGAPLPSPHDDFAKPGAEPLTYDRLREPSARELKSIFKRLLEGTVAGDSRSTRPDDQLNQTCNLLLLKLHSDTNAADTPSEPVRFQMSSDEASTAKSIHEQFEEMRLLRTDVFTENQDQSLVLDPHTIQQAVYELSPLRLLDMGAEAVSTAFQVFRRANLKAGEGQYFTPRRIIDSAVELMDVRREDKIIDPACGTGGFLIQAFMSVNSRLTGPRAQASARTWAHKQVFGVDKDSINVKLARAVMVILGDGSANIHVGDSIRTHRWGTDYPHIQAPLKDNSYTVVLTNPPFGRNLRLSQADAKRNKYSISNAAADNVPGEYAALEIGLIFLERSYRLLVKGGRLGIILPETYFFSPTYSWLPDWLDGRLELRGVFNIPMEAFQGFCRAKTNFYVFEKV